ncbi:sushi repeat-containing protein SRPX2 [Babesia caballi]|uniref:Sushi repeat-containing protein SRPX2 n=1 Tax=Babesia caballi TaxID=5871 RepID=A0AAV4LUE3_BABCB|nr:sushi repeat-containing protein SRPX2 [Babesia caballi]
MPDSKLSGVSTISEAGSRSIGESMPAGFAERAAFGLGGSPSGEDSALPVIPVWYSSIDGAERNSSCVSPRGSTLSRADRHGLHHLRALSDAPLAGADLAAAVNETLERGNYGAASGSGDRPALLEEVPVELAKRVAGSGRRLKVRALLVPLVEEGAPGAHVLADGKIALRLLLGVVGNPAAVLEYVQNAGDVGVDLELARRAAAVLGEEDGWRVPENGPLDHGEGVRGELAGRQDNALPERVRLHGTAREQRKRAAHLDGGREIADVDLVGLQSVLCDASFAGVAGENLGQGGVVVVDLEEFPWLRVVAVEDNMLDDVDAVNVGRRYSPLTAKQSDAVSTLAEQLGASAVRQARGRSSLAVTQRFVRVSGWAGLVA